MKHRHGASDTEQFFDLLVKLAADQAGTAGNVENGGIGGWSYDPLFFLYP